MLPYADQTPGTRRSGVKTGYEMNFNRHFYKPQPMRSLDEIRADIIAIEKETEGLFAELIGATTR